MDCYLVDCDVCNQDQAVVINHAKGDAFCEACLSDERWAELITDPEERVA